MQKPQIMKCMAREILDSRGNPTIEASVLLSDGTIGTASVPSGASTGIYEAHEKRDTENSRYCGKGVLEAVGGVCRTISPTLVGCFAGEQSLIDTLMIKEDGTENKSNLGANAILAVSLANARACAAFYNIPLYRYLGGIGARRLPIPMMNILNGGAHASNNVNIQEFMIAPIQASSFSDALRMGSEIYHTLGKLLKAKGKSTAVGDEGGYAPMLDSDEDAIEYIIEAIESAGYTSDKVKIALDVAASEWYSEKDKKYIALKTHEEFNTDELCMHWKNLVDKYPIFSIEDPLDQRDFEGWAKLTSLIGEKTMVVGDDLFVTNTKRLSKGISQHAANSILVKPNQIGTLSEVAEVITMASVAGYSYILSHRSGETEDTTIADIAVGLNAPYIKSGAPCRTDRVAKYNRLLRIEASLGSSARYGFNTDNVSPKVRTYCGEQE